MILDLIYGYLKPLEKASYCTKSKGRKEESIGRVFKKLILVKSSYTWNNYFEITFMFSAQSLLVGNGTSVTCLRKSREPITALNLATYVTPLMVRNFWLWNNCRKQEYNFHVLREIYHLLQKKNFMVFKCFHSLCILDIFSTLCNSLQVCHGITHWPAPRSRPGSSTGGVLHPDCRNLVQLKKKNKDL